MAKDVRHAPSCKCRTCRADRARAAKASGGGRPAGHAKGCGCRQCAGVAEARGQEPPAVQRLPRSRSSSSASSSLGFGRAPPERREACAAAVRAHKDRERAEFLDRWGRAPTPAEEGARGMSGLEAIGQMWGVGRNAGLAAGPEVTGRNPDADYSVPGWARAAVFAGVIGVPMIVGAVVLWLL